MNILHLIENLDIGGAQVRLLNDLKFIDKKRFNNIVCSLRSNGRLLPEFTSLGIKMCPLSNMYSLNGIVRFLSVIRKNHIDVIHTQLFFADLFGRLLGRLSRVPFIITTVQSAVYEPNNTYLYSYKRKLLDKYSGRFCNKKFIAVSEFVKNSIVRHLKIKSNKIEVIHNYVDFEQLNQVRQELLDDLRIKLSIKPRDIILITVGRLNPAKGLTYLLDALPPLVNKYKNIKLVVVGNGFCRVEYEKLSKDYGIEENVMFLGERDDVKELVHLSDIFIFPSLSEGMPLSLLEAMAIGKPCIASGIPSVCEVIKDADTGLLVRPKDSQDIKNAIELLIKDPAKAKRLGQCSRDFIKKNFNPWEKVRLLEQLYMSLS